MFAYYNYNSKNSYWYKRYMVNEITNKVLCGIIERNNTLDDKSRNNNKNAFRKLRVFSVGKGKYAKSYYDVRMGFDIETTTVSKDVAFMWQWKLCINEVVIEGRKWEEFIDLLDKIKKVFNPSKNQRLICFIHNEGFEFQFMRKWLKIEGEYDTFFKEERKPCFVTHDNFIIFQDSMLMSNSSLAKLAKDYTNTQKAVGDLDYAILRSNKYKESEIEGKYSDNDVLILSEYAGYYIREYLSKGFRPLTKTSALNKEVVDSCKEWCRKHDIEFDDWKKILKEFNCRTKLEYDYLVNWVYRGGYVHGNEAYVGWMFDYSCRIRGYDITSSYPSVMYLSYFPMSKWEDVLCNNEAELKDLCKSKCVIFQATFYNIEAVGAHSIESFSKCIECKDYEVDNGRVRKAKIMKVGLTELDFASYQEFYTWEKMEIDWVSVAERGLIFEYLLRSMLKYYIKKDELKKAGEAYDIEKSFVNTFYGLCVKRLSEEVTKYYGGDWHKKRAKEYGKQIEDNVLTTFIGVYISAHARRNLLKVVNRLEVAGYSVLYVDTDSIKILYFDDGAKKVIDEYNDNIKKRLVSRCNYYNIPFESVRDLGMFDEDYSKVIAFKFLGAKRYLISYLKKDKKTGKQKLFHNQVIAGVPKNLLFKRYYWLKVYDMFDDDMVIEDCKLTSFYIDDGCCGYVNGDYMEEKSALALVSCEFNLNLDEEWLILFLEYQDEYHGREFRLLG